MKSSEKKLVGSAMVIGGLALVFYVGMAQFNDYNAHTEEATSLKEELKSSEAEKMNLTASIARLKHNIAIPLDIEVKTFTNSTESTATKELLDHVVGLATQANNKFISLSPVEVDALFTPPSAAKKGKGDGEGGDAKTPDNAEAKPAADSADGKKADAADDSSALLVTKGYELTIRGTYESLQSFLRAMDAEKMVFDMFNFELINELSGDISGEDSLADPSSPLRLKLTLRLAMQRVEDSAPATK